MCFRKNSMTFFFALKMVNESTPRAYGFRFENEVKFGKIQLYTKNYCLFSVVISWTIKKKKIAPKMGFLKH